MPLSRTQKGAIGQFTFLATALATGKGQLEVYSPAADNEGRDAEVRRHLKAAQAIGIQVKVAFYSAVHRRPSEYLDIRFATPENRLQDDPRFWYFFAYYHLSELRFHGPCFLIPSRVFHKMGRRGKEGRLIWFSISASLKPNSRDRWSRYRVAPIDLGMRLLEIIDEAPMTAPTRSMKKLPPDAISLGRAIKAGRGQLRTAFTEPKYALIRKAVLERDSVSAWYHGHPRLFTPFVLGTKAGDPHVLAYQFGGTSHQPLQPEGSPENWRCLRVAELTKVKVLPGIWHPAPVRKGFQKCVDHVDVSAGRPPVAKHRLRRAA